MDEQNDVLSNSLTSGAFHRVRKILKGKIHPLSSNLLLTAVKWNAPLDIIESLWDTGCFTLNERSYEGKTVLTIGTMDHNVLSFLLSKGADPTQTSRTADQSALVITDEPDIQLLMLKYGANPYHVYPDGRSVMDALNEEIVHLSAIYEGSADERYGDFEMLSKFAFGSKALIENTCLLLVLLQSQHDRLGSTSILYRLPKELFRRLAAFLLYHLNPATKKEDYMLEE